MHLLSFVGFLLCDALDALKTADLLKSVNWSACKVIASCDVHLHSKASVSDRVYAYARPNVINRCKHVSPHTVVAAYSFSVNVASKQQLS